MSNPIMITLTGEIWMEGEEYVSACNELDISTTGRTVEEIARRTDDMIKCYFEACRVTGQLAEVLSRLRNDGVATPTAPEDDPEGRPLRITRNWKSNDVQHLVLVP